MGPSWLCLFDGPGERGMLVLHPGVLGEHQSPYTMSASKVPGVQRTLSKW